MALFEATCPDCNGPLEKRDFVDGENPDGELHDVNRDWWCPACEYRWMSFEGEPEAEG